MPEKSQTISLNGSDVAGILTIAYGTLEKLEWKIKYAGENLLVAYTPGKWNYTGEEITIQSSVNELTVTSKMVHNEAFDISGRNKKHIKAFLTAFDNVRSSSDGIQVAVWQDKIAQLKEQTILIAEEEIKNAEEVNSVMNLSTGTMYVTWGIIAINLLVFIAMVVSGISFISPSGEDIVKWGGNFSPYTNSGDWWRLITCVFVHIGIIHLLFNMYALYTIGVYLEPMLGKTKYIIAYLCTGVFASLASLWWHETPIASAGASGAIFGMYGVFLALLSTSLIPKHVRSKLLQSIGIFVGYNLLYGMKSGIDNAAHIGGLVSGFAIGYIYYLELRRREEESRFGYQPAIIIAATIATAFFFLKGTETITTKDDSEKFSRTMEHFAALEELALEAMQNSDTISKEVYLTQLKKTALTDWVHCVTLFEEAEKFELSKRLQTLRGDMLDYSKHRLQQTLLFIKAADTIDDRYNSGLDSIQNVINLVMEKIQKDNASAGLPPGDL